MSANSTHFSDPAEPVGPDLPLFQAYPGLSKRLAHVSLLKEQTPIRELRGLASELEVPAGTLWVKRDDISDEPLGGNKARKLEFILPRLFAAGSEGLITSGMYGSNHALATAVAARRFGMKAELILGPQPVTDAVRKKLLAMHVLGAKLHYHGNLLSMGWHMLKARRNAKRREGALAYVPAGGTSPLGNTGYVNAFLEMVQQSGEGGLPERIILPVGTGGTAAGLMVGSCLAGTWGKVQIVGVGVATPVTNGSWKVRREAKRLYRFLRRLMSEEERRRLPECDFDDEAGFAYTSRYYRPGYGRAKANVHETIRTVRELESLQLDATYTGKAMQFLLDDTRSRKARGLPVPQTLFWHTYNSFKLDSLIEEHQWSDPEEKWRDLPRPFWKLFK